MNWPFVTLAVLTLGSSLLVLWMRRRYQAQARDLEAQHRELTAEVADRVRAEEALRESREELEVRVAERTLQLELANRRLTEEVEAREQARADLLVSKERYRALFHGLSMPVVIYDNDARIVVINEAGAVLLHTTPGDLEGRFLADILPVAGDTTQRLVRQVIEARRSLTSKDELPLPSGKRWFRSVFTPITLNGGRTWLAQCVSTDITESHRAEEALKASEERYRELVNDLPLHIVICDAESRIRLINRTAATAFGARPEDLEGRLFTDIAPGAGRIVRKRAAEVLEAMAPMSVLERIDFPDGPRWMETEMKPHSLDGGATWLVRGMSLDVSDQRHMLEALEKSEAFLNETQRMAKVGGWEYDLAANTTTWTEEVLRLHGLPLDAQAPDAEGWLDFYAPEDADALRESATRAIKEARPFDLELRLKAPEGEERWVLVQGWPRVEAGRVAALTGTVMDVTHWKEMEEDLLRAKERAETANRAKSEFLANVSHEVRTPLNGVLGMLQLMQHTPLSEEQTEYVETALASGRGLLGIINDILDFTKIEAGGADLTPAPFNPRELVDQVIRIFHPQARDKGLALIQEIGGAVPDRLVGDEGRIRQMLFNLVGNAVKFTDVGEVLVSLAMGEPCQGPDGGTAAPLTVTVRDTGVGIPPDQCESIFEPFRQVDGSLTRRRQGAGLGLGIVRRLTGLMGGEIAVESRPGEGARFTLTLPLGLPSDQAGREDSKAPVIPALPEPPPCPAARKRVLVVEDNRVNSLFITRWLERNGFVALKAESGEEALELLAQAERGDTDSGESAAPPCDIVFMDIQMPGMDGMEAARRIREGRVGPRAAGLPIIALTAHAMAGDRERFLEAGMNDYLPKPVDVEDLRRMIATHASV